MLHQRLQTRGQDVAGHAQPLLPLFEPAHAVKGVADDQQGPRIADHLQRGGDRAALAAIVGGASHAAESDPASGF
ncbi:hypothetical protein D3C81_1915060 [compost metagenome]